MGLLWILILAILGIYAVCEVAVFPRQLLIFFRAAICFPHEFARVLDWRRSLDGTKQARKEFEKNGINLKASIPMVVVGKGVETNFITNLPIISLPFEFSVNNGNGEVMHLDFSFE